MGWQNKELKPEKKNCKVSCNIACNNRKIQLSQQGINIILFASFKKHNNYARQD